MNQGNMLGLDLHDLDLFKCWT